MALTILLDEHLSTETAYRLTALGFNVVPARDRGLLSRQDWELLPWCIERGYTICTRNGPDFEREHLRCQERGQKHFGILVVGPRWSQEEIYWALRQYLESDPDPTLLMNQVVYLPPATEAVIRERPDSAGT